MNSFPEMRRSDRALTLKQAEAILDRGEYGFLAMCAVNGYGYGIPLGYARDGQKLYFHSARDGFKVENIAANNKASFCVVGKTEVLPAKFSTAYESAMVFGPVTTDLPDEERKNALRLLVRKYSPAYMEAGEAYLNKALQKTLVLRLDIEHMCGKARRTK